MTVKTEIRLTLQVRNRSCVERTENSNPEGAYQSETVRAGAGRW